MLLSLGDRRIHFDLLGESGGDVVYLAHALSADMGIWSEQVPALLAAGWRVLRADMRGHGGSSAGQSGPYTMSDLAGDVVAVLDHLDLEQVHFVGLSIGGMIGQQLGIEHPDRIRSLMLCDTSATNIPGGGAVWDERFAAMRAAGSLEPLADATLDRWVTEDFQASHPARSKAIRATVATTSLDGYFGGGMAILKFDCRRELGSISLPTLVVWGDEDPGTPPAGNILIADSISEARRHVFPGARHVPMVEFADEFSRVMLSWLTAQTSDHSF